MGLQDWTIAVVAVGVLAALVELFLIHRRLRGDHDWNRRVTALRFGFGDDPTVTAIRVRLNQYLRVGGEDPREIGLDEIREVAEEQYPEAEAEITLLLNKLECMCVAIENRIADEGTCRDMVGGITTLYYRTFLPFIEEKRRYFRRDSIYQHLEHYAHKWSTNPLPKRRKTG